MSQVKKQLELNNFSGGLNTEQSPLAADPSTSMQEQNMVLASDGSRARRYGYEYETEPGTDAGFWPYATFAGPEDCDIPAGSFNNVYIAHSVGTEPLSTDFSWLSLRGVSGNHIEVLQSKDGDVYGSDSDLSLTQSNAVQTRSTTGGIISAQFGSTLVIPAKSGVCMISVDPVTPSQLIPTQENIHIRDFFGVEDNTVTTERSATLLANHAYNLLNQGWTAESMYLFYVNLGVWPSNADVEYFGRLANGSFDADLLKSRPFPSGAPKGKFIHPLTGPRYSSAADKSFDTINTLATLTLNTDNILNSSSNPQTNWWTQTVTSFMGRAFYTGEIIGTDYYTGSTKNGSKFPSARNYLFFTSVLEHLESKITWTTNQNERAQGSSANMCISKLSPTDENFAPSYNDGGYVVVANAEILLGTVPVGDSLAIIATNGIWELRAADGVSPSSFIISKVSSARTATMKSVVSAENKVFVPTEDGILALYFDASSRRVAMQNISDERIRTTYAGYYRWFGWGTYDAAQKSVRWLLHTPPAGESGTAVTVEQKELVLDLRLGSYSLNAFESCIANVYSYKKSGNNEDDVYETPPFYGYLEYDGTGYYIANYISLKNSYTLGTIKSPIDLKRDIVQVKLLVLDNPNNKIRFIQPAYKSFTDLGGSSVSAFMVSNPVTMGDTIRRKDIPYIWTHFYRTEDGFEDDGTGDWIPTNPSGCLLSARWDFSDNVISGKWSTPMQVYRLAKDYVPEDINDPFTYGHNIITTKSNLPGSGKAVSIKIESDGDKDLQILGWGAEVAITGAV